MAIARVPPLQHRATAAPRISRWFLAPLAPISTLLFALWPPVDVALLVSLAVVLSVAGAVLLAIVFVRLALRWSGGRNAEAEFDSLFETAPEGAWPCGPMM